MFPSDTTFYYIADKLSTVTCIEILLLYCLHDALLSNVGYVQVAS